MDRNRAAVIEKAREKRNRQETIRQKKGLARRGETVAPEPAEGFAETLKDITQGVIEKVGEVVKTTAHKLKAAVS